MTGEYGFKCQDNDSRSNDDEMTMERKFNTAGPSVAGQHYMIDPLARVDREEIENLIDDGRYFILHAPRQTGKTSTLLAMLEVIHEKGRYACVYTNIEAAQAARGDAEAGIAAICSVIARSASLYLKDDWMASWIKGDGGRVAAADRLSDMLSSFCRQSPRPLVLLLDEVDALVGNTLISLLRQIRAGYAQRPGAFPQSVLLCGVRDVRDYRMHLPGEDVITGGSAFNIKAASLRMGNFSEADVRALWQQHTDATGQTFDPAIFPELWEDTRGQPWLVNALGHQLTWQDKPARDRTRALTLADYRTAREVLIQSRATHLDQLSDKLQEPRVHRVLAAVLASADDSDLASINMDDQQYVEDLGLITLRPSIQISNRIYREVLPRDLVWVAQTRIANQEQDWYLTDTHRLDMVKLLRGFQQFYREQGEHWAQGMVYKEAGRQLVLQAFLQRIINGGGRIHREYGLGRKRTDLLIEWPLDPAVGLHGPMQRVVLELKVRYETLEATIAKGLEQTLGYVDQVGADEAHLLIFETDVRLGWEQRIWQRAEPVAGREVMVWGV